MRQHVTPLHSGFQRILTQLPIHHPHLRHPPPYNHKLYYQYKLGINFNPSSHQRRTSATTITIHPASQSPPPSQNAMNLIFDFDGTITVKDTIFQLAQSAISFQSQRNDKHLQTAWDDIVQAYGDDHKAFANAFTPPSHERCSPSQELAYLSSLTDTENASLDRVDKSGLFRGLTSQDLFQMGRDQVCSGSIVVREGFIEMLELARENGWHVAVISVNWSRAFIEGVLHPHKIPIITNCISAEGTIQGPDDFNDGVRLTTSRDKANSLNQLISKQEHSSNPTVYFGDSTTDMECLLAHHGIVISADATSSLMQTLERVGVRVPHVGRPEDGANIFWARDFREILESQTLDRISKAS